MNDLRLLFQHRRMTPSVLACSLLLYLGIPQTGSSFTQSGASTRIGSAIPVGHEWITRQAALELLGSDPVTTPDAQDPRKKWKKGKAKNPNLSAPTAILEAKRIRGLATKEERYLSRYQLVFDAIIGERWVDTAGFSVAESNLPGNIDCFSAVAQEPAEVQYDHFLRRTDDTGPEGGARAIRGAQARFVEYFVSAALAAPMKMKVYDGGASHDLVEVDRNYFLLGRAVHLLQDSFSAEHAVRAASDNYERVREVKSYQCTAGSELHSRAIGETMDFDSGDVIWKTGTKFDVGSSAFKPSNMKELALVATEATKDLWAAFIRTMGTAQASREKVARDEAMTLAKNWMSFDEAELAGWYRLESNRDSTYVLDHGQTGKGQSLAQCLKAAGVPGGDQQAKIRELRDNQLKCLYNIVPAPGYSDLYDTAMHMPYNWTWEHALKWDAPPVGWKPPERSADTGTVVKIKSLSSGQYLTTANDSKEEEAVACKQGPPLTLVRVPAGEGSFFRLADHPGSFLNFRDLTGAMYVGTSPTEANFVLKAAPSKSYTFYSVHWQQYLWVSNEAPTVTKDGSPDNTNAQWILE